MAVRILTVLCILLGLLAAGPSRAGALGISQDQLMAGGLSSYFPRLTTVRLPDGSPGRRGVTADGSVILEMAGDPLNLQSVSLIVSTGSGNGGSLTGVLVVEEFTAALLPTFKHREAFSASLLDDPPVDRGVLNYPVEGLIVSVIQMRSIGAIKIIVQDEVP